MENNAKPITYQGDLAKLPKALAPLIARPQWAVWRWTQSPMEVGRSRRLWRYSPIGTPARADPSTWTNYTTALTTVQAKRADGLSYILTEGRSVRGRSISIIAAAPSPTASTYGRKTGSTPAVIPIRK